MSGKSTLVESFELKGTKKGTIAVSHLESPYGAGSDCVASIGVSLAGGENPDWKVHIPYAQIDEICSALQKAKEQFSK